MTRYAKTRSKVAPTVPNRKQRIVCLLSNEEQAIIDGYLKKYGITNKGRWMREVILGFIQQNMDSDYPTLFTEHEMRR